MMFVNEIKSRSSDKIIYAKLFIYLSCNTRQSLDDLYFFILTKKQTPFYRDCRYFLNCRYSKANNFSQVVLWPVQDYHRTYSHFSSGPRHGLSHSYKKLFIIPY